MSSNISIDGTWYKVGAICSVDAVLAEHDRILEAAQVSDEEYGYMVLLQEKVASPFTCLIVVDRRSPEELADKMSDNRPFRFDEAERLYLDTGTELKRLRIDSVGVWNIWLRSEN